MTAPDRLLQLVAVRDKTRNKMVTANRGLARAKRREDYAASRLAESPSDRAERSATEMLSGVVVAEPPRPSTKFAAATEHHAAAAKALDEAETAVNKAVGPVLRPKLETEEGSYHQYADDGLAMLGRATLKLSLEVQRKRGDLQKARRATDETVALVSNRALRTRLEQEIRARRRADEVSPEAALGFIFLRALDYARIGGSACQDLLASKGLGPLRGSVEYVPGLMSPDEHVDLRAGRLPREL